MLYVMNVNPTRMFQRMPWITILMKNKWRELCIDTYSNNVCPLIYCEKLISKTSEQPFSLILLVIAYLGTKNLKSHNVRGWGFFVSLGCHLVVVWIIIGIELVLLSNIKLPRINWRNFLDWYCPEFYKAIIVLEHLAI